MTYFAVKHVPTGRYLPQLRRKRGYTHAEPAAPEDRVPRLHRTKRQAKTALTYWLKGAWNEDYAHNWESGASEYCGNSPSPKPERKAEEMRIVKIRVEEVEIE